MTAAIMLEDVTISYHRHPAVHHISGAFERGSLTAIAGPNGAGKSTLLKGIAGMLPVQEGRMRHEGRIAYLPQASTMQRDFPMSVLHMVTSGFWYQTGGMRRITPEMKARASQALEQVGLGGSEGNDLSSLSVGQFQRALFARLLVQDADILLLDEPFNAIDENTVTSLLLIIRQWQKDGRTVVCVLHDLDQIRRHFPDCLLMARECVAWGPSEKALSPENLLKARFLNHHWENPAELCEQAV